MWCYLQVLVLVSQASSSLIMVRKDEICTSRWLCVFHWSKFVRTVQFSLWQRREIHLSGEVTYSRSGKVRMERELVSCGVFFSLSEITGLSTFAKSPSFVSWLSFLIFPLCVAPKHRCIWASFELASSGMDCILQLSRNYSFRQWLTPLAAQRACDELLQQMLKSLD